MSFSDLFSKVKELAGNENVNETVKKAVKSDAVKKAVKKVATNKNVKNATKKVTSVAKAVGIDMSSIVSFAMKNKTVLDALTKLGLKKESDPTSGVVQKLVSSLNSAINKTSGIKLEDKTFSSVVSKLLGNTQIKDKLEDAAGKGVTSFIKKAVAEYIA